MLHLIVQAFKEVGQNKVTEDFLQKIKTAIHQLNDHVVQKELKYAPVWIQKLIKNLMKNE